MLLSSNIRLRRILINTWKVDLVMFVTCCVAYSFHYFLLKHHFDIPVLVPTVLGTAIAFFIGFNNNQAYDRWWEARRVWGSLVNDSRSWARNVLNYITGETSSIQKLQHQMIRRHIAFVYLLKNNLHNNADDVYFKNYLSDEDVEFINNHTNKSNALLQLQSLQLKETYNSNLVDGYRFLQFDALLVKFTDEMGMSERIKGTIFPTTYSYLTKVFIWLFVIAVQLVTVQSMGIWSILMSWVIGFVFVSTQINGMSLVNPFDTTPVAIPLNQIARNIEINLLQMMHATDIPEPVKPVNNEYIL